MGGGSREGRLGGGFRWGILGWCGGGWHKALVVSSGGGGGAGSAYLPLPYLAPYHHHKPNRNLCSNLVWPCQPC